MLSESPLPLAQSDGDLARRAAAGCVEARDELVRRWSPRVLAFCHARVGCVHTSEDLAQETLLRGMRGLASLRDPDRFGPWLRGIAHRVCLDWHKGTQQRHVPFSHWLDGAPAIEPANSNDAGTDAERRDEVRRLMELVGELPEPLREVLLLYYYDDVTYRQLAEMLDVSVATVNARLTQARMTLRRRLGVVCDPPP